MTANARTGWHPPELIVVTRGQPEEAVLAACKGSQVLDGPEAAFQRCFVWGSACAGGCNGIGDS
jgi:hypothetical protein